MFENLKDVLSKGAKLEFEKSGTPTEHDLKVASALLLLHVAKIDKALAGPELQAVVSALNKQFAFSDEDAATLIAVADFLHRDQAQLDSFAALLNDRFTEGQRVTVLGMMWRVITADGVVSKLEALAATELTRLLGLGEEHLTEARKLSEAGKV